MKQINTRKVEKERLLMRHNDYVQMCVCVRACVRACVCVCNCARGRAYVFARKFARVRLCVSACVYVRVVVASGKYVKLGSKLSEQEGARLLLLGKATVDRD